MRTGTTIEEIILESDRRGIALAQPRLPRYFCASAARLLLSAPGRIGIATGFWIESTGTIEPDGPPGALALARALSRLGKPVVLLVDDYAIELLERWSCCAFPLAAVPVRPGKSWAAPLGLSAAIAVERCGRAQDGDYYNMAGRSIREHTAPIDLLFDETMPSCGIGDGGNEIGIGPLCGNLPGLALPKHALSAVSTTAPVIATTSNWGAWGVVAALGAMAGLDLLPAEAECAWELEELWGLGILDPLTPDGRGVDGFSLDENLEVLSRLRTLATER